MSSDKPKPKKEEPPKRENVKEKVNFKSDDYLRSIGLAQNKLQGGINREKAKQFEEDDRTRKGYQGLA
jgi:hypothetical protein